MTPALQPEGHLIIEGPASTPVERTLIDALKAPGIGHLFLLLGTDFLSTDLPPPWSWLRTGAKMWLQQWCLAGTPTTPPTPSATQLAEWLSQAPPFPGAHHLSTDLTTRWWQAFADRLRHLTTTHPSGIDGWLAAHGSAWHRVGRVTFHLAENPADPDRPFAFLATFTETVSGSGQLQHLPLARALQRYTRSEENEALETLLTPIRRAASASDLIHDWLADRRLFQPQALTPSEAHRLLCAAPDLQEAGIVMKLPDWWRPLHPLRPTVSITLDSPQRSTLGASALISFRIERSLDGVPLTDAEWEKLMSANTGLVSLRGKWVEVSPHHLREALQHWQRVETAHREQGVPFHQAMRWLAGLRPTGPSPHPNDTSGTSLAPWTQIQCGPLLQRDLSTLTAPPPIDPPPALQATLRPYQLAGLNWLHHMHHLGLGACLADDMGLGKTLQLIALLLHTNKTGTPTLIVVPASLLGNWRAELRRFASTLRVFYAHPSLTDLQALQRASTLPADAFRHSDVVLTTYHLLQRTDSWQTHRWHRVVLDEAQAIKNPAAAVTQAVKRLHAPHRIAMTGTPIENRPGDLWSLFDFLNPGLLGTAPEFNAFLQQRCSDSKGYTPLRRLIQPYLLRRMKTDRSLIPDLPDKIELQTYCGLTRRQATIYAKLVEQLSLLLRDPNLDPQTRQGQVLAFLTQFKQVCNHPSHWNGDGIWHPADSGKFQRLTELATTIHDQRERTLVFTQFRETCQPLQRHLSSVFGRPGLVLHGGTPVAQRATIVNSFQAPDGPPFLVISVKAGGTGLNLTAATHVIHFDRWWNPAIENQATDRAFRLGQTKKVLVHKFVCRGTIEERIDTLLRDKQQLATDLIGTGTSAASTLASLSPEQWLQLIALDLSTVE